MLFQSSMFWRISLVVQWLRICLLGGSGWGIHVYPWLIHVNVWQKPLQYCKVISLQLIKKKLKKKKKESACSAGDAGDLGSIPRSERSLEEDRITHSSILAWKIPWTEEPGRLQSMGSQRVGHYWVTLLSRQGKYLVLNI